MPVWTAAANSNSLIRDFSAELGHDTKSLGGWDLDYAHFCKKFSIIPCPYFRTGTSSPSKTFCKLSNTEIDISCWRAMLLACTTIGCTINEIRLHHVRLTAQHITELVLALEKLSRLDVLKLNYLDIVPEGNNNRVLRPLISCQCAIDYISLCGNDLNDSFILEVPTALTNNLTLRCLNLAENKLTENGATELFRILKFNNSLRYISLKDNNCNGSCLDMIASLIVGMVMIADDDSIVKAMTKSIAERNKVIKEQNKKRKKLGMVELEEIANPSDKRAIQLEKKGPHYIFNHNVAHVDLSRNPIQQRDVLAMIGEVQSRFPSVQALTDPCNLKILLTGVGDAAMQERFRDLVICDGIQLVV